MYLCLCKGLTESDVQQAMQAGETNPDSLTMILGLDDDDCCGRCAKNMHRMTACAALGCLNTAG